MRQRRDEPADEPQHYGPYGAAPRPGGGSRSPYDDLIHRLRTQQHQPERQPDAYGPPAAAPPPPPPPGTGPAPNPPARRGRRAGCVVGLVVLLLVVQSCVRILVGAGQPDAGPDPSGPTPPQPDDATAVWQVQAAHLRADLAAAELTGSIDGAFDGPYVADAAGTWVVMTGGADGGATAVHGLDPTTGEERWRRDLDQALCAPDATADGALFCAAALDREPGTGLGTRWRLHLLDPATGEDRASADVDGWLTAVHVTGETLVVLEEREPNPHAVLRGFGGDLQERWRLDLAAQDGHDDLFTSDRIISRPGPGPDRAGLVLDRPRFRDVGPGGGILALWAGMRTAFVDPIAGALVAMPWCSRLVDDGERLWCNEPDGVVAYSYAGERLHRVNVIRLLFPSTDGDEETDVTRPVFADDDGKIFSVDRATGLVHGPFVDLGVGSAFGMTIAPSAYTSDGHTFVAGEDGLVLLDAEADAVRWSNREVDHTDPPIVRGGTDVLVGAFDHTVLSMDSGRELGTVNQPYGLYTVPLGEDILAVGPEEVALLELP